jgi:hypothetical protein
MLIRLIPALSTSLFEANLAHAVQPSGTGILREDRPDRAAQRIEQTKRDRRHAVNRRLAGHRVGPKNAILRIA